jgi:hypothetical protein
VTLDERFMGQVSEAVAAANWEAVRKQAIMPLAAFEDLTGVHRHNALSGAVEVLKPAWPIIDREIDDAVTLHAGVLRGRIEMFIEELRARGSANIAAELEQIINETIED